MQVQASAKFVRMSPRKVRLVSRAITGLPATRSVELLSSMPKKAAGIMKKLVESAIANATHNHGLNQHNLLVKEILVNEGPTMYRYMPRAFGRATPIRKKMSHITVTLDEIVPGMQAPKQDEKAQKQEEPQRIPDATKVKEKKVTKSKAKLQEKIGVQPEIFDERRKGKHRSTQHQDKSSMKQKKG